VTPAGAPDAPAIGSAAAGIRSASFTFTAPAENGAAITSYKVQLSQGGGAFADTAASVGAGSASASGLSDGTGYAFRIAAVNDAGTGPYSAPTTQVTTAKLPAKPSITSAVPGDAQVTVAWTDATVEAAYPITQYRVTASPGGASATTSGATSAAVTGLANGTAYTFTVAATNAVGIGPASDASSPVTPSACGNGVVDSGEQCDSTDDCGADCRLKPACTIVAGDANKLFGGIVLAPSQVISPGQVLVDASGIIRCVAADCTGQAGASSATRITCAKAVISPGLINAHEHSTFVSDPWTPDSGERYEHRQDWRVGHDGHSEITSGGPSSSVEQRWAEVRHLMAATTSISGSGGPKGLLRNLDSNDTTSSPNQEGLGANQTGMDYETFPLGDGSGTERTNSCAYPGFFQPSQIKGDSCLFAHVAEGIEASALNEFQCIDGRPAASGRPAAPVNLLGLRTAFVHAVALSAPEIEELANSGTGYVWSPRSNVRLYGNTSMITAFKRLGVQIALGTDWLRSGSMNVLRELRCAKSLSANSFGGVFSDEELWRMVTSSAADVMRVGHRVGRLVSGRVADIAIFRAEKHLAAPHTAVVEAEPIDVVLTLRAGKALYGDAAVVAALGGSGCEAIPPHNPAGGTRDASCVEGKHVCLGGELTETMAQLTSSNASSYELFFCKTAPRTEPTCVPSRQPPWVPAGTTAYTGIPQAGDGDGDGVPDAQDNCPGVFNPVRPVDGSQQADSDGDGIGDACDAYPTCAANDGTCPGPAVPDDLDGDGVLNGVDNCPVHSNPGQADADGDGIGDACDPCPASNLLSAVCKARLYDVKKRAASGLPLFNKMRFALDDVLVTAVAPGAGWFLQVHENDLGYAGPDDSGVFVSGATTGIAAGDRLDISSATVDNLDGQIRLTSVAQTKRNSGNPLPAPIAVTVAQIADGGARAQGLEGVLVRLADVAVSDASPAPHPGDAAPTYEFALDPGLRVNDLIYRASPFPAQGDGIDLLTGILERRHGHMKLEPRAATDIVLGPKFGPAGTFTRVGRPMGSTFPEELRVTISAPRGQATPVTITTTSGDLTLENGGALSIAAGDTFVPVRMTGVNKNAGVELTASIDGKIKARTVRVLGAAELPTLVAIEPTPAVLPPGTSASFSVKLDIPAFEQITVGLQYKPASAFTTAPASVDVPAEALGASFSVTADAQASGTGTIRATYGLDEVTADLTFGLPACVPSQIVISQIFGGGGNTSAPYQNDFIELHNRGNTAVSLGGWSVQYASSNGTSWTNQTNLSGTIQPGAFFLVQEGGGAGNGSLLPAPDVSGTIPMAAGAGKVALVKTTGALSGACPSGADVVDFVPYGSGTGGNECLTQTADPSNTKAVLRNGAGCDDTDSASADFTASAPAPRNSSSAANQCGCGGQ